MDDGYWINEVLIDNPEEGNGIITFAQLHARLTIGLFKNATVVVAERDFVIKLVGYISHRP